MRKLCGDFGKAREAVAGGGAAERVRGNIEPLEVLAARSDFLEDADVRPQVLQVVGGLLEEKLDGFAVQRAHARPSVTSSAFCCSCAVGLRYIMQSPSTMA